MNNAQPNYEKMPADMAMDETDVNLRAYFSQMSDERLRQYDPKWSDDDTVKWDGNFRDDGVLFLVCSERDIAIEEYRQVLEEHLRFRGLGPAQP